MLQNVTTCNSLQRVTTCYNMLQLVITCCNLVQHVTTCCDTLELVTICCDLLQHVATCCERSKKSCNCLRICGEFVVNVSTCCEQSQKVATFCEHSQELLGPLSLGGLRLPTKLMGESTGGGDTAPHRPHAIESAHFDRRRVRPTPEAPANEPARQARSQNKSPRGGE